MSSKGKRIAVISEHASPMACMGTVDTGGQNVYVDQIAKHLAQKGYRVDVFTRCDDPAANEIVQWGQNVRIIHIKAGPETNVIKEEMLPYMHEFADNMLSFIINQHLHYELVHANFFMSGLVACEIKKALEIPFVITFHALGHIRLIHQAGNDKFPAERITIEEMIVREADHIIAECPQDEDDLIRYYHADPEKVSIVPCGFNPQEFYPVKKNLARKILGLPQDKHILLQLGRMVPRKGIDNVIRALGRFNKDQKQSYLLVIVGGDQEDMQKSTCPEYRRLLNLAEGIGVSDNVLFAGRKERGNLKLYYSAADVFITTPWYEPFGITPLESMACGTPVIGSDVGGIKYSIADGFTGALVKPDEPWQLANKVTELINDPGYLEAMGKQAVTRVHEKFTWARVAEQIINVYKKVIVIGSDKEHSKTIEIVNDDSQAA